MILILISVPRMRCVVDRSLTRRLRTDKVLAMEHSDRCYPVQLDLRYKVLWRGECIQEGVGRTRECSARAISFTADQTLSLGAEVRLSVDWPVPLDGICPLQLIIFGHIVRRRAEGNTLKIVRYEFRTHRSRTAHVEPRSIGVQMES